jgi:hypothetical protein
MRDSTSQWEDDAMGSDSQWIPHIETEDQLKNVQTADEYRSRSHRLDLPVGIMPKSYW